jgi:hypothetical protein
MFHSIGLIFSNCGFTQTSNIITSHESYSFLDGFIDYHQISFEYVYKYESENSKVGIGDFLMVNSQSFCEKRLTNIWNNVKISNFIFICHPTNCHDYANILLLEI